MRRRSKKGLANGSTLDKLTLIQVDFEQDFLAGDLDEAEIVLAEGVVVLIKIVISRDGNQNGLI
jgi:hypothetical protein